MKRLRHTTYIFQVYDTSHKTYMLHGVEGLKIKSTSTTFMLGLIESLLGGKDTGLT